MIAKRSSCSTGAASGEPSRCRTCPRSCRCRCCRARTTRRERIAAYRASIRRLAPFRPDGLVCLTGPAGDLEPAEARRIVVAGLRELAAEAEQAGLQHRARAVPARGHGELVADQHDLARRSS